MDTSRIVVTAYDKIPGIGTFQGLGTSLLMLALSIYMVIELYKFLTRGHADFVTPIIKIGAAIIVINSIIPIGSFLSGAVDAGANGIFDKQLNALAAQAFESAMDGVSDPSVTDYVKSIFSPSAWLGLLSWLFITATIVIKIVVIDIVWPVMFALVLFSGALSVPIGVFPGVNSAKNWAMNLVEIALWPLVFQLLISMLTGTFSGQLEQMAKYGTRWKIIDAVSTVNAISKVNPAFNDVSNKMNDAVDNLNKALEKDGQDKIDTSAHGLMFHLVRFLGYTAAFMFLCLFTPFIARKIVRGESAGFLGGVLSAAGTSLVVGAARFFTTRVAKNVNPTNIANKVAHGSKIAEKFLNKMDERKTDRK
jgi:hypothetical protein